METPFEFEERLKENMGCDSNDMDSYNYQKVKGCETRPMPPTRHPNSARFHEILREAGELHDKKQADYGRGQDPFANVNASAEFGVKPWIGAYIRLNDK